MSEHGCRTMRAALIAAALCTVMSFAFPSRVEAKQNEDHPPRFIMTFETMYGVDGPFVGEANSIRGVIGDELPWTVAGSAKGRLTSDGRLKVRVRGLVFTDDDVVPPELRGKNDEDQFRAMVSCLTETDFGVTTANVTTQGFPATESGDSDIDADVVLPNPCVAPIILILAGSEDKWFAVTGFESESGE